MQVLSKIFVNYKITEKIKLESNKEDEYVNFRVFENDDSLEIKLIFKGNIQFKELSFEIEFNENPLSWRNHDYSWVKWNKNRISNELSPKIIKFENENYLLANRYLGVWAIDPNNIRLLNWHIHSVDLSPFFYFDENGKRIWIDIPICFEEPLILKLYYGKTRPIEISRSKIPFSPVLIFTDHCDFDSDLLLQKQREFFKKHGIKVTKGFFLHHYSKKGDWNSSFEKNTDEYYRWKQDGHELCYHALSQSTIWDDETRLSQFENFSSPAGLNVTTWIDHGYQLYNLSKIKNDNERINTLKHFHSKGINLVWNYNDAGEAIYNLNQNNFESFNFKNTWFSKIRFRDKVRLTLFYFGNEDILMEYRELSGKIQEKKGKLVKMQLYVYTLFLLMKCILKLKTNSKNNSKKNTQIFFLTQNKNVTGFQTVVVKDWVKIFAEPLDRLVNERGVSIIHSYFAFLGNYHVNPLFQNSNGEISRDVENSFAKFGLLIRNGQIWNPTIAEFHNYTQDFKNSEIILENGYYAISNSLIQVRAIQ